MALWWWNRGYIFPVVVKPDNLTSQVKFYLEGQDWMLPKTIGTLTKVFCTSGPNLVVLAWMGGELSRGQAQNKASFDFEVKFDLAGRGQSPHRPIRILAKVFYTYGQNLVTLASMADELSHGQIWWRTDRLTQATTIPRGQNWPWVIKIWNALV